MDNSESGQGNASSIQQLTEMVSKLREENEKAQKNIETFKEIMAKNALGGFTNEGIQAPVKKEETPEEYRKRFEQGR